MIFFRQTSMFALALALLLPATAQAGPKRTEASVVEWTAPSPATNSVLAVPVDSQLTILLGAQAPGGTAVRAQIRATQMPGGTFTAEDGNPARAKYTWTPARARIGDHRVTFTAVASGLPLGAAESRTFVIRVIKAGSAAPRPLPGQPALKKIWPKTAVLSDYKTETYKWAFVTRRTVVRRGPSRRSRAFSTLKTVTPEFFPNLVQMLHQRKFRNGQTWVRVRLAVLPNSSTGWIPRRSLGRYRTIRTRLFISRSGLRATLYRRGRKIFTTRVGVGQSHWPTPRGDFYTREVLTGYGMPVYGPIAIGISARSSVLTDWPGGGFIGIHGTNQPHILPGYVSHGCVRMRNGAIARLRWLMPLGTPVQVR
jgi:lipoprotein-anchoring transpeptidase ErfK/SrfK